jgi:hypothetical protein
MFPYIPLSAPRMSLNTPFSPKRLRKYQDRALQISLGERNGLQRNLRDPTDIQIWHGKITGEKRLEAKCERKWEPDFSSAKRPPPIKDAY